MSEHFEKHYTGFAWIEVPRHRDDSALTWEERFKILEQHHIQETQFLIDEIRKLAKECDRRCGDATLPTQPIEPSK